VKHGSLFSGIGGFDLAAEWMGWENLFNCEWEEFPRKVLKHHFPNAKQYGDIKQFNASTYAGRIDILTGGFPCQPYSTAGKRKGKEDERHLWPEMLRVIRECAPRYIVGENVRGLVSWNGGMVFEEVCADLETCGYSVQPFILPACAVNAPHRRDRVWFVAHANDQRASARFGQVQSKNGEVPQRNNDAEPCNAGGWNAPDTASELFKRNESGKRRAEGEQNVQQENRATNPKQSGTMGKDGNASDTNDRSRPQSTIRSRWQEFAVPSWSNFPTVPSVCGGDDGLPKELDGITFPKWRRESIKAYGNAIVPQVALRIFEAIQEYEKRT